MSLQRIPHDATKYRNNPVELLDISKRNRIGSEYALTANTKLLITGTGENNSTTILDSTGKTVTRYGDTKISTAQSIIGGSSIYFDGTGDYLTLADSADWDFGTGNLTIDFWWYATSAPTYSSLIGQYYNNCIAGTFELYTTSAANTYKIELNMQNSTWPDYLLISQTAYSPNTWNHFAIVRESTTSIKLYHNGIVNHSLTIPSGLQLNNTGAIPLTVGAQTSGLNPIFGYLSHLRITKGQALWTANFTPPKFISDNYIGA
jgi:hypothetical protein